MKQLGKIMRARYIASVCDEINCWRIDNEERHRMILFAMCVLARMGGVKPDSLWERDAEPSGMPASIVKH